jgi:choline dehydrogenase-like flavoprotein
MMLYDYADHSPLMLVKRLGAEAKARRPVAALRTGFRLLRHAPELTVQGVHTLATGKGVRFEPIRINMQTFVEQIPDPENRVTLSNARDCFGIGRPRLTWRVHAEELRTMRRFTEVTGAELRRLGLGELTVAPWLDQGVEAARPEIKEYFHHAGATRMASHPADGVTDPDCRVFGTDNLYIAGSSVFPTSGYANPTLTIAALAIRLAETLRARLAPA